MRKNHLCVLLAACLAAGAAFAVDPQVKETLKLAKGWNAVYIESTPPSPACRDVFRYVPEVVSVACYRSKGDAETAQYDESGQEIYQQPVVFLQWVRDNDAVSSLTSIAGGYVYLIYATAAATVSFTGEPTVPTMLWRKVSAADTNEYANIVGVSSASSSITIADYFGEGPFGTSKKAAIYEIGGEDRSEGPTMKVLAAAFGRPAKLAGGKAYALTAERADNWPGVIGVVGRSEVSFGTSANHASVKIRNRGTKNHIFQLKVTGDEAAEPLPFPPIKRRKPRTDALSEPEYVDVANKGSWTVTLKPGEDVDQVFSVDRSKLEVDKEYGAILEVSDLSGSLMRVRMPIYARGANKKVVQYPTGLWVGEIALTKVSQYGDAEASPTPVTSGGELKMNVMVFVDENKKCTLLQRVAAGVDSSSTPRLFKELANVPAAAKIENPKRFSTVMMSVDTPAVAAASDSTFGDDACFTWAVDSKARDNPFRHAWHPDHDGKTADYSEDLPSGDDFTLYRNPIKPELWSISNRLDLSWHEQGNRSLPTSFPYTADESTSGIVTWDVWGLIANKPIRSVGTFSLKRVFKAKTLEE